MMPTGHTIAALIIAYRRSEQVLRIIEVLSNAGVNRIYLALDMASDKNPSAKSDSELLLNSLLRIQEGSNLEIFIAKHSENVGCSAAVLSACEWFFSEEDYGIVLEDDCIPSLDFVSFALSSKTVIDSNPNIWLACGTQFAPSQLIGEPWMTSRYALIWGWATSKARWQLIVDSIKSPQAIKSSVSVDQCERQYWNAGSRRSSLGIVDAWDNVLISQMIAQDAKAILPRSSLVSNVGFDSAATHTKKLSQWLAHDPSSFQVPKKEPNDNSLVDDWLRKHFYQISFRHLFSTRITLLIDIISGKRASGISLRQRAERAKANFKFY